MSIILSIIGNFLRLAQSIIGSIIGRGLSLATGDQTKEARSPKASQTLL